MPAKIVELPEIGTIRLYKRRGARNIRLSVSNKGEVRVTLPPWLPYRLGVEFAASKAAWIAEKTPQPKILAHNEAIGKNHVLVFESGRGNSISTRLTEARLRVILPADVSPNAPAAQAAAERGAIRALKTQAEAYLPARIALLAELHGFKYRRVRIRQLKGRWGSCSQQADITLNCFLMQLPDELIDYVLLHELVHTRIMAHGPKFWQELAKYVPDLAQTRKAIRAYGPWLQ